MDFDTIAVLHKNDPALLALRKEWLPLAISFMHRMFKQKHEVMLSQVVFLEQLDIYLDHINKTLPEPDRYKQDAAYYIDRWSREDDLIRIRSREDDYVVQLSPHAERLIGWFEDMQNRGMVGTESRLRNIISLIDDVVARSTEDVEKRLQQLYEQRARIDEEIARVEETQQVDSFTDVQIRERLDHISGMATQLLRDFSLVEERFREMARTIQQAQLDPKANRGDILGTALEADAELETSDEGQSFRAFYQLLTHPEQREAFDTLINDLLDSPRILTLAGENAVLQRLTSHLLDAGERVNQSNQRLAEHLRRVVDTRNIIESRRVQTLAAEIKHIVSQLEDDIVPMMKQRRFYSIEGEPDVDLPLERPLFEPPELLSAVARPRSAPITLDEDALVALYDTFYIDETRLRGNIERLLMSRTEVPLADVVESYPIQQGVAEIIAYLHIAAHESQHDIDRAYTDKIPIKEENDTSKSVAVPRILFRRDLHKMETEHAG